jgi:CRISPR/Cas system-associated protein Cas10 (large subunit of type III CRISPR-Cas system)
LAALEKDRLQLRQREEELATAVSRARARADAEAKKARKLQQAYVGQRARGDKLERAYRQSPRYLASRIYRWVLSWRRPANGK